MTQTPQDTQAPNPLQLGQVLYEVLDTTVIATPRKAAAARYNRVQFNNTGGTPLEPLSVGAQSDLLDARAVTDMHAGKQAVFVLQNGGLRQIGSEGGAATQQEWTFPTAGLHFIVDLDPQRIDATCLLLLGQNSQGIFLQAFNAQTGQLEAPLPLVKIPGTVVGGVLVRNQLNAHLLIGTVQDGQLSVHDLGTTVLGVKPQLGTVTTVALGPVRQNPVVSLLAASLQAGTADQQAVLAYPDSQDHLQMRVLGWDKNGALSLLASLAPDTSFATPERPVYRLAAGDLLDNGLDQLVVGFSGTYQTVQGCAALLLLELGADGGKPALHLLSTYAAANTDQQPFASIDLHLAVGLFGELLPQDGTADRAASTATGVLGVLLIGGGATLQQLFKGEASVLAGLVTVDPTRKIFPPLQGAPGTPQLVSTLMTIDGDSSGFFAFPSDVTGQSVVLGPPVLSQSLGKGQLLAVVQAPPFEAGASTNRPSLTFSQSSSKMVGYNVSSNKMWMFSQDTGGSIGVGPLTLGRNVNNSYGNGFDKIDDQSSSTMVQMSSTITDNDLMVMYAMSYDVWTYPVYRKAKQSKPDGTLAVVFPKTPTPVQTILPASDPSVGYKPRSQVGTLLSYANLLPEGYTPDLLLFSLKSFPVTDDTGGSSVVYDQTEMVSENITRTFMVHNSATDSAHFAYSTTLFDYIPINFGLNLSGGETYSQSDVQTTMLSHTTTMSITITSGSVNDIGLSYQITPYIYQHETMGCLMVSYEVSLTGKDWQKYYRAPQILLQSLYPNSKDPMLSGFSRSISFQDNKDGTVKVSVELFNNNLKQAQNATCEFYVGTPGVTDSGLTPPGTLLGQQSIPILDGGARGTVSMDLKLQEKDQVVVKVYSNGLSMLGKVYWGIYPATAFADWQEMFKKEMQRAAAGLA